MPLLIDVFRSFRQQLPVTAAFVGGTMLMGAVVYFGDAFLGLTGDMKELPSWYGLYATLQDLFQVAGVSALQVACFATLGSHMDRPVWRCNSMQDAFARFYLPWVIINLIDILLSRLQVRAVGMFGADAFGMTEFIIMLGMLLLPTAGACVMHHGRPSWHLLGEALAPVLRYPFLTMQAMIFPFTAYILRGLVLSFPVQDESFAPFYYTLMLIPFALLSVLGFLGMWRVCMHYRDHGQQDADPYDF